MINWEIVRLAFYAALYIGAPVVFFLNYESERETDSGKALNSFNSAVDKTTEAHRQAFKTEIQKKDQELKEKDEMLRQKDAELTKIRPLLKYVRSEPASGDASKANSDFGEDTV